MRILVIAPYPPVRDGIAAYALQSVARLRREGNAVEVLSPYPSAAHHHLELGTIRGTLQLIPSMRRFDRVIINYHPDVFFRVTAGALERERVAAALALAWRAAHDLEVRVHEADYARRHRGVASLASRAMWHAPGRIIVHTETERRAFHEAYGIPLPRISVAAHGGDFATRTVATRQEARARLGLPDAAVMFLTIGFIQPHKGFDRAVRAFAALGPHDGAARLDIVGSVRVEDPHYVAHFEELRSLAEATEDVHLHAGFVSDEQFDTWIVAADAVVLPYRYIWSSGVLERAALYDTPVIAARVGGLADQARANTVLVDSDEELTEAMRRFLVERGVVSRVTTAPAVPWPPPSKATRQSVMRAVQARAAPQRTPDATVAAEDGVAQPTPSREAALSAPLRRLAPLQLAAPVSRRPGVTFVKRVIRKLTRWELDPIVAQVNELQRAMAETLERRR